MRRIELKKVAAKFIEKVPAKHARQITEKLLSLAIDPFPPDSKRLSGAPELLRVDVGEYRIIYQVEPNTVWVPIIGKRNDDDVYRQVHRMRR